MQGLELSEKYFNAFGMPVLTNEFADVLPCLAAGLIGEGSECFGFDDEVSRDHDFEPSFCIFIPGEEIVDRRTAFLLERAYAKLPKEFLGFKRSLTLPVGGARRGALRISELLKNKTGSEDGALSLSQWLTVPEQSFAEITNGRIFFDNYGLISQIRNSLSYYPDDIRRKKLAGQLLLMSQSGQYNYLRCIKHGETGAAQLAVNEFVNSAVSVIFLLNKVYRPYYKWAFRALRSLPLLSNETETFEFLLTSGNNGDLAQEKYYAIEGVAADIIDILADQSLTKAICGDLEKHAYSVNDSVEDAYLRNAHILSAV